MKVKIKVQGKKVIGPIVPVTYTIFDNPKFLFDPHDHMAFLFVKPLRGWIGKDYDIQKLIPIYCNES